MNNAIARRIKRNRINPIINEQVNLLQSALQPYLERGDEERIIGLSWDSMKLAVKAINHGALASDVLQRFPLRD